MSNTPETREQKARRVGGGRTLYLGIGMLCVGAVAGLNYFTSGGVGLDKKPGETVAQAQARQAEIEWQEKDAEARRKKFPNYLDNPEAGVAFVRDMARKHGSNFDALSADDQAYLNGMTAGNGRALLRKAAADLRASEKESASALKVSRAEDTDSKGKK
jgi:hypothetical protein